MSDTRSSPDTSPDSRRRVLVVDDNEDSAVSLAMMLELMGNESRAVFDGMTALEAAADFKPDVILLDIEMPTMNGLETARRIREQPWGKDVLLLALTGWGQSEDKVRSLEAGFDAHLVKPIEPEALNQLLLQRRVAG